MCASTAGWASWLLRKEAAMSRFSVCLILQRRFSSRTLPGKGRAGQDLTQQQTSSYSWLPVQELLQTASRAAWSAAWSGFRATRMICSW